MYVSTLEKYKKKLKHTSGFVLENKSDVCFFMKSDGGADYQKADAKEKKRMSGNTQKEEIYRTAMRICRMWGVAETLDDGIPPYENPKTAETLMENEKLVLEWAEEYNALQNADCELWSFFIKRIKNLTDAQVRHFAGDNTVAFL